MATVHLLEPADPSYPSRLRALADPPNPLWVRGSAPGPHTVAIVGTRTPSRAGRRAAALLTLEAVDRGWDTIAGLATGIDEVVHECTLAANGRSWAFVGDGVDVPEHPALALRMCRTGGGVCSEQPPGTAATTATRRQRDRLQAALAHVVIVAEASADCGTLHTVSAARALGRPVVVVRHRGSHPAAAGSRRLLADTGSPVRPIDLDGGVAACWTVVERCVSPSGYAP